MFSKIKPFLCWEVCEMTQKSMASRAFEHGGIYTSQEQHIRGLVDYIWRSLNPNFKDQSIE